MKIWNFELDNIWFEWFKEKAWFYFEDIKTYFANRSYGGWKTFVYLIMFILTILWLYFNNLTYQFYTENWKIKDNIKLLKDQNKFLEKNKTQLVLIKTLDKDKNVNLVNYIFEVYKFIKNYKGKKNLWDIKIKSVTVQKQNNNLTIQLENITDYAFFDKILEYLKEYKNNVDIKDVKIKVDENNKKYFSYIMSINLDYSNIFNNN